MNSGKKILLAVVPTMSNLNIFVIVEGQTEQTFVREVLAPELASKNIFLYSALIGKPGHKGGKWF